MPTRVICHPAPGHNSRNRAGRTWPAGPTVVPDGELTRDDLTALRSDPRFTVVSMPDAAADVNPPVEIEGPPVADEPTAEPPKDSGADLRPDPNAPSEPMEPLAPEAPVAPVQELAAHRAEPSGPTREQAVDHSPHGKPSTAPPHRRNR